MFEPTLDWLNTPSETEEETSDSENADFPDLSHITLSKLFHRDEFNFLQKCIAMISELTGEEFTSASPEWLKFGGMQLEVDGYCEALKMAIDYQASIAYSLPPELMGLYTEPAEYMSFATHVLESRIIMSSINGIALIPIPSLMPDDVLRDYLVTKLHELTRFRVWVGSPRCKCPPIHCTD